MLLLGHACWGYLTGRFAASRLGIRPNLYLLLLLGMLPDIDLILGVFGVQHRTLTHSLIFWTLVFTPVLIKYRYAAIPYFIAVTQHILFGDLLVGRTSIFWPVNDLKIGLALPILSPISLAFEGVGLALFCAVAIRHKELVAPKSAILAILVLVPLIGFILLAAFGASLLPIFLEGSDARYLERNLPSLLVNPNVQVAVLMHVILVSIILTVSIRPSFVKREGTRQVRS